MQISRLTYLEAKQNGVQLQNNLQLSLLSNKDSGMGEGEVQGGLIIFFSLWEKFSCFLNTLVYIEKIWSFEFKSLIKIYYQIRGNHCQKGYN